jgi:LmbE family N-acetylglucosaminyl deacetylase
VSTRSGLTDISAFRLLNVAPLENKVVRPRWSDLVADLEILIRSVSPSVIVAPHPYIDAHSDHRFTALALCEAAESSGLADSEYLLYMNYGVYSKNLPHGPRTSLNSLPPWFEQPFPFESIYSHQLSNEDSAMKAIALEAMRDFREFDMRPKIPLTSLVRNLVTAAWGRLIGIEARRKGYFRYASRPNEIFFVTSADGMQEICSGFLARWDDGEFGHYQ